MSSCLKSSIYIVLSTSYSQYMYKIYQSTLSIHANILWSSRTMSACFGIIQNMVCFAISKSMFLLMLFCSAFWEKNMWKWSWDLLVLSVPSKILWQAGLNMISISSNRPPSHIKSSTYLRALFEPMFDVKLVESTCSKVMSARVLNIGVLKTKNKKCNGVFGANRSVLLQRAFLGEREFVFCWGLAGIGDQAVQKEEIPFGLRRNFSEGRPSNLTSQSCGYWWNSKRLSIDFSQQFRWDQYFVSENAWLNWTKTYL